VDPCFTIRISRLAPKTGKEIHTKVATFDNVAGLITASFFSTLDHSVWGPRRTRGT
jgi:hypothetical protein